MPAPISILKISSSSLDGECECFEQQPEHSAHKGQFHADIIELEV